MRALRSFRTASAAAEAVFLSSQASEPLGNRLWLPDPDDPADRLLRRRYRPKEVRMKRSKLVLLAGLLAVPGLAIAQGDMERQPDSDMPGMETSPSQVSAQMFKNKDNFDLEGTVSSVDPTQRQITIQREGMPSVELQVASDTEVKVNGEESSLSQIQPGDEVRTEFNLAQDQAIAVKVEAKESKERRSRERREGERTRGY
nr:MAG: hypothetical protein DIU72_05835 [Pseudomonadota bacterium]